MKHSLKTKIILIIFFTITASVFTFLLFETTINARLYRAQVEKEILATVKLGVGEVDHYTHSMEQKATDLASAGEIFYKIKKASPEKDLDVEMREYLIDTFSQFDKAIGGGIWYEPYMLKSSEKYYGPYAFWDKGTVVFTWDLTTPKYDYINQNWYTLAIPPSWDKAQKREREYYWTAPYYDEAGTFQLMVTVDAFMYDNDGTIIGISTADWSIEKMLTFLRNSRISTDSEIFLIDANSNTVMANTLDAGSVMKSASSSPWISSLERPVKGKIKMSTLTVGTTTYNAYYTLTDASMFYGTLVPVHVLSEAADKHAKISLIGFSIFDLLLVVLLYVALQQVTNPIIALTSMVSRIASGDLSVRMKVSSRDEIGRLGLGFNQMVETLATQKDELEKRAVLLGEKIKELEQLKGQLEVMVVSRTKELGDKVAQLEQLNKFMINRELRMISLKEQIKKLEAEISRHSGPNV